MKLVTVLVCFAALFVQNSIQASNKTPVITRTIANYLALVPGYLNAINQTLNFIATKNDNAAFNNAVDAEFTSSMDNLLNLAKSMRDVPETAGLTPHPENIVAQLKKMTVLLDKFGVSKAYILLYYANFAYQNMIYELSQAFMGYGAGTTPFKKNITNPIKVRTKPITGNFNELFAFQKETFATYSAVENFIFNNPNAWNQYLGYTANIIDRITYTVVKGLNAVDPIRGSAFQTAAINLVSELYSLMTLFMTSLNEPQYLLKSLARTMNPAEIPVFVAQYQQ